MRAVMFIVTVQGLSHYNCLSPMLSVTVQGLSRASNDVSGLAGRRRRTRAGCYWLPCSRELRRGSARKRMRVHRCCTRTRTRVWSLYMYACTYVCGGLLGRGALTCLAGPSPLVGGSFREAPGTTQNIALTPRENNFRSFFRSCFPSGLSLDFEQLLLKIQPSGITDNNF